MQITAAQMAALSEARKKAFLLRVHQFIQEETQHAPQGNVLTDLFDRASRYGLVTERQFAGYIVLAWQSGVIPPASDPNWIAEVMSNPRLLPDDKVDTLFGRASSRSRVQL
jgi:hypothetical protein